MPPADAADVPRLRAFVDAQKRAVQQSERAYDVRGAALALAQLARPLTHPSEFPAAWKRLYLDLLYRDVAKFALTFVAAHVLPGFSAAQRSDAFDVFFEAPHVPALHAIGVLLTQIAATKPSPTTTSADPAGDEAAQVLAQSVRLLQRVLDAQGVRRVVDQLLEDHESLDNRAGRALLAAQPTISSLCSAPDLVFNRLQRSTPSFFAPRTFQVRVCEELLDGLLAGGKSSNAEASSTVVFRLFAEKLARIGHMEHLVRAWLARRDLYDPDSAAIHRRLIGSLPIPAFEPFLQHLAGAKATSIPNDGDIVSSPQYLVLSLLPEDLCLNKQFQFVVAHKLLLAKPVRDPLFLRMLVNTLAQNSSEPPLHGIFDVVVSRWSGDVFPLTADYGLNSSITMFLRLAMKRMDREAFVDRDWTMKLCKGVQAHMAHSVERVRLLGMRVGESVSMIMSPEQPLNFEIAERDPLEDCLQVRFDFSAAHLSEDNASHQGAAEGSQGHASSEQSSGRKTAKNVKKKKKAKGVAWVDPDEVVDSDENGASDGDEDDDESGAESDSDMSLDAYDLADDEEDLQAPRPLYIKDLLASLHAEDAREKTETALAEAETLLRKQPKDLQYSAKAVVQALLRLEDKYSTPNFITLRARALAAACALAPTTAVPFLQTQALEREQLLRSRVDVLQAMASAAQELSQTGMFRPNAAKNLLREDLDSRTMEGFKTRRFGYRRDPLAPAKKNAFGDHALAFFSPLLFGYVHYAKALDGSKRLSEVEDVFLAHLLNALSTFVECAGHAPAAVPMAKGLMEFAWHYRSSGAASVRRQVLYAFSRVLLVMPPFLLRQELGQNVVEMMAWLQETHKRDPDDGCREASRLLLSSGAVPMLTMP